MLELDNIGQFNLIVGDNNVGKSSLLEALCVTDFPLPNINLLIFTKILQLRGIDILVNKTLDSDGSIIRIDVPSENFLKYIFGNINKKLSYLIKSLNNNEETILNTTYTFHPEKFGIIDELRIKSVEENIKITAPNMDADLIEFHYNMEFRSVLEDIKLPQTKQNFIKHSEIVELYQHLKTTSTVIQNLPLITTGTLKPSEIISDYFSQVGNSRSEKKVFLTNLKFILPGIEDFEVRKIADQEHFMIGIQGNDELVPISMFGEAVLRSTYLLLQISKNKGKRLMIDEVDTGIHHTRLKNFMKTLIQVAHAYEVQLFMTTHSLECQQAFVEALEIPEMEQFQSKARNITLFENTSKQVNAQIFKFESMKFALETGFEIRGE